MDMKISKIIDNINERATKSSPIDNHDLQWFNDYIKSIEDHDINILKYNPYVQNPIFCFILKYIKQHSTYDLLTITVVNDCHIVTYNDMLFDFFNRGYIPSKYRLLLDKYVDIAVPDIIDRLGSCEVVDITRLNNLNGYGKVFNINNITEGRQQPNGASTISYNDLVKNEN